MLGVQAFDQAHYGLVIRNLEQPTVEAGVPLRDPEQVAFSKTGLHLADNRAQVGDIAIGNISRRIARRQTLEHGPRLKRLDGLLLRDRPNSRATVWLAFNQTILLKARQGGADRRPPDVIELSQIGFDQALVWLKLAAEDRLIQARIALIDLSAALGRYHRHPRINTIGLEVFAIERSSSTEGSSSGTGVP